MEWLDPLGKFLRDLGFPIFVAVWLLVRVEKLLHDFTHSNFALREAIHKLIAELERLKK